MDKSTSTKPQTIFTPEEIDEVARFLVTNQRRERENIIIPRSFTPTVIKTYEEKRISAIFESCPFKAGLSCVAGENIFTIFTITSFNNKIMSYQKGI